MYQPPHYRTARRQRSYVINPCCFQAHRSAREVFFLETNPEHETLLKQNEYCATETLAKAFKYTVNQNKTMLILKPWMM